MTEPVLMNPNGASRPVLRMTYIGGPTALLEIGGLRLLTDPTFDAAGAEFRAGAYALNKVDGPAVSVDAIGEIDAVLLSHDHHFDNLDDAGRALLAQTGRVLTTVAGAERLGGNAEGLAPWQSTTLRLEDGRTLSITATPARHGPAHADRGPVVGFVLEIADAGPEAIYVSGDTVWYEGVAEVAHRFPVKVAVLFMGAAQVDAVGPWHLTLTAEEAVEAARVFTGAAIVPLHFEGWKHFREHRQDIERAFREAGLGDRVSWLPPGRPHDFTW